jgi:hypothetical protein
MFGFLKSGFAATIKATFNQDMKVLRKLPNAKQLEVHGNIAEILFHTLDMFENNDYSEISAEATNKAQIAQKMRHLAMEQGAKNQEDIRWLSSSVIESFHNCIRTNKELAAYAAENMISWLDEMNKLER